MSDTPPPLPNRLIPVPEETLIKLLHQAGINQTPEQFLATGPIKEKLDSATKYQRYSRAAYWSRIWLGTSACFSLFSFITELAIEDFLTVVLLSVMTYIESRVHDWFLEGDPRAAVYGYWNQTTFATLFVIYGVYHYNTVTTPPELVQALGPDLSHIYYTSTKATYIIIGLVGGLFQFLLALHYKKSVRYLES